ncbi:MAG: hypothetical protein A2600_13555 [Candidatus Lambdaproteobacteria bacterium RIFOXYD1_FULL_56_27]|uniref:Uncharacterized protein n=1 Tax=Candidatus Lambdaproteobacteria bacterium RIFOXYD2_FULL_56_26 TaxID=1817773 RepID=A0A1F6H035_9PROT|nr:MAG: hypothetical protein A2557_04105 [Candidatus Lambdaproteobacteria bacterium RIFOXYD2_FULL_56_26]OGH04235.1 MAG: hypothetical protein A2426_02515 [Candidatus Lambdaproteobacteria bacterium RIFOXYC1_FULL_56_13]OGH07759.1 MAG: hypothetical protein A2600_13555 [Candidatus Lambdaproteobacteria bacterium RIFOXYD1_FULL_56_27]
MKILILTLQILLAAVFVGFTLWAFELELALGLVSLVLLALAQVVFLSKRIRPRSSRNSSSHPNVMEAQRAAALLKGLSAKSQGQRRKIIAKVAPDLEPELTVPSTAPTNIDPSVFSKFQKNLDSTQGPGEPEAEVVVKLSGPPAGKPKKAAPSPTPAAPTPAQPNAPRPRNPYAGGAPAAPAPVAAKKTGPGAVPLFEQTRTKEQEENKLLEKVPAAPLGDLFEGVDETLEKPKPRTITPKPRRHQEVGVNPPLAANEILDFKSLEEESEPEELNNLQLKTAQKALAEGELKRAADVAQRWLAGDGKKSKDQTLSLQFVAIASQALFGLKEYPAHLKLWEKVFGGLVPKTSAEYLPLLEERIEQYVAAGVEAQAVPFLLTALSSYQAQDDSLRMDQTYLSLEKAYRDKGDQRALAQCLEGHGGVKRTLKDYSGLLEILDELGKLLFNQGDQEGSSRCYEESLVVKQQLLSAKP